MFDIGALELLVIGVVALLVVGPERLPHLARTAGRWVGRARRALLSVKDEIDREIKAEELREILRRQNARKPLDEILEQEFEPKTRANKSPANATQDRSTEASITQASARQAGTSQTAAPTGSTQVGPTHAAALQNATSGQAASVETRVASAPSERPAQEPRP